MPVLSSRSACANKKIGESEKGKENDEDPLLKPRSLCQKKTDLSKLTSTSSIQTSRLKEDQSVCCVVSLMSGA
jgi:hypothetical protein